MIESSCSFIPDLDLFLEFGDKEHSNYKRELDLKTGIVVFYQIDGVDYTQKVLCT